MRPLLLVISASLNWEADVTAAFHASHNPSRYQSITDPFDNHHHHRRVRETPTALCATSGASGGEEQEQEQEQDAVKDAGGFTALPAIGASSFWDRPHSRGENNDATADKSSDRTDDKQSITIGEHTNLVSSKFQIQYTCKVCSTRNSHSVTRLAYRKGVVIAMCKGCLCRHLLADNLGWSNYAGGFNFDDGETNIEIYMENKARENRMAGEDVDKVNDLVMRVNREVFNLEQILYKDREKDLLSTIGNKEGDVEDGDEMGWS